MSFPQVFSGVSAYKDPVENQHMIKILDKMSTGFFVILFGILWYCSARYYVKPNQCKVVIYDVFGKQVKLDEIRTNFNTLQVARNYILEYHKRFPHYGFSMAVETPEIKSNTGLRIFKKFKDNGFSCE